MTPTKENAHILVIDDEVEIAEIIKTALHREGFTKITLCSSGLMALEAFKKSTPDLVLLDIMLPDLSGYELFRLFKAYAQVPILFVSAKGEELDRLHGFELGADDYITKPFSPKELAYRVKARLKSSPLKQPLSYGDLTIDPETGEVKKAGTPLIFTAKEYKLLMFLIAHPNQIISKEQICEAVWGEDFIGFDNTISVHIRRLRKKIEDDPSNPRWIQTVIGMGYKFTT